MAKTTLPATPSPTLATAQQRDFEGWVLAHHKHMAELSRRGMALKARQGILPGGAPLGYRNLSKRIEVDPQTAPLVKKAFERAASSGLPLRALLKEMTDQGLHSKTGKPLSISAFWYLLRNPFYTGMLRYRGELIQGVHEPLISREVFDAVDVE